MESWLQKAKDTQRIHVSNIRSNDNWTIAKTAKALGRSIGSVSEDLLIARWHRIHPNRLEKCSGYKEALEWIRNREKEIELEES